VKFTSLLYYLFTISILLIGLLEHLRSITEKKHLSEYRGLRAAVDAHCWLHRAKFCCITELASGIDTDKFISYCMDMVNLLLAHGIKPLIVFDGRQLPAKCEKNEERRLARENSRLLSDEAMTNGDEALAYSFMKKCVGVSSKMVRQLIDVLKSKGIEYMVSPYESDAQLAFLSRTKLIDLVITEDSDAIVYGCLRTLFKLNRDNAMGDEIFRKNMGCVTELSFSNWSDDQFKLFCCLSGCDYVTKLKNMGIKTAYQLVKDCNSIDSVISALRRSRFASFIDDYFIVKLEQAWLTFKHQLVYDPVSKTLKNLTPITETRGYTNMDKFLGEHMNVDLLHALVDGSIDPHKMMPYDTSKSKVCIDDCDTEIFKPIWRSSVEETSTSIWSFGISSNANSRLKSTDAIKSPNIVKSDGLSFFSPTNSRHDLLDVSSLKDDGVRVASSSKKERARSATKGVDFFQSLISEDQYYAMQALPDSLHRSKRSRIITKIDAGSEALIPAISHFSAEVNHEVDNLALDRHSNTDFVEKIRDKSLPFFKPRVKVVDEYEEPSPKSPVCDSTSLDEGNDEECLKENSQPEVENRLKSIISSNGGLYVNENDDISSLLYSDRIRSQQPSLHATKIAYFWQPSRHDEISPPQRFFEETEDFLSDA